MKDKLRLLYRFLIGLLGIFFIVFNFIINKSFFFSLECILYLVISIFCAHYSINFGSIIVSFEILMNFFIYLVFGYQYAAIFAFLTIILTWYIQYFKEIKKLDANSKRILTISFFNSGMYAFFYSSTGIILWNIQNDILKNFFSIILFIIFNEVIIIIDILIKGLKELKEYLNKWFIITLIIESLTYSLAIPISIIYKNNGFLITFPLFIALLVFSFIGNRMIRYQEKLRKNISKIKELNDSSRIISSIIKVDELIKTILDEAEKLFNAKEIYLNLKFEGNSTYYLINDGKKNYKKVIIEDLSNYKLSYKSKFVDIYINKDKIEKDEEIIFEAFCKQCEISLTNAHLHDISIHDSLTELYTRKNSLLNTKISINGKPFGVNFSYSIFTYNYDMELSGAEIFRVLDKKLLEEKKIKKIGYKNR